jgi:hypothetical protein
MKTILLEWTILRLGNGSVVYSKMGFLKLCGALGAIEWSTDSKRCFYDIGNFIFLGAKIAENMIASKREATEVNFFGFKSVRSILYNFIKIFVFAHIH